MWDSNAPLQLLKSMPKKLNKENLEKIQLLLDADKYKNSLVSGFDLCGMYAPFCRGCQKTSIYPCAIAYINMMKEEGMDIEIDARPVTGESNRVFATKLLNEEQTVSEERTLSEKIVDEIAVTSDFCEEKQAEEQAVEEQTAVREIDEIKEIEEIKEQKVISSQPLNEPPKPAVKRKIRIAVARKKI